MCGGGDADFTSDCGHGCGELGRPQLWDVSLGGLVPVANEAAEGSPGGVPGGDGEGGQGGTDPQPEPPPFPGEQQGPRRGGC